MKDQFDFFTILNDHPFTGTRKTDFYARLSQAEWHKGHYDGSPGYDQIKGVTPGKTYHVTEVEGYGDAADFRFTDDNGNPANLGNWFFEKPIKYREKSE